MDLEEAGFSSSRFTSVIPQIGQVPG